MGKKKKGVTEKSEKDFQLEREGEREYGIAQVTVPKVNMQGNP